MQEIQDRDIDWATVGHFLTLVWRVCLKYGGSVSGGCRTEERNAAVGGHPQSKHLFETGWGMACDAIFDTPEGMRGAIIAAKLAGIHTYRGDNYEPTQVHFQWWSYGEVPTWPRL